MFAPLKEPTRQTKVAKSCGKCFEKVVSHRSNACVHCSNTKQRCFLATLMQGGLFSITGSNRNSLYLCLTAQTHLLFVLV